MITSTLENSSDIGVCLGLTLGPPASAGVRSKRGALQPTYAAALAELRREGKLPEDTLHRQVKYLKNVVEADHGKLKQLIRLVRGFKTLKTAYATIKGFEVMRALPKGQVAIFKLTRDVRGEARIIERAFGLGLCVLAEAAQFLSAQPELQAR